MAGTEATSALKPTSKLDSVYSSAPDLEPEAVTLRLPEAIGISILIGPIAFNNSSATTSPAACIKALLPEDGDLPLSLIIDKSPSIWTTKSSPVTSTVAPISAANILPPPLSIICINKPAPKSTAGFIV